MNNNRLLELDALRGLAAIAVVLYHFVYRFAEIFGQKSIPVFWAMPGKYGVNLFFIVSGFVIYWTLSRIKKPQDFIISRFSRLYPVFWASVLLTFFIVAWLGLPGREQTITTVLFNFLMFHEFFSVPHVDGVYWTLTVELAFYFWVFILYLAKQLQRIELWLSIPVCISVIQALGIWQPPELINTVFFTQYVAFFMAGVGFFKIANQQHSRTTYIFILGSLASTFIVYSVLEGLLFSFFYLVFYLAVMGKMQFLAKKPLIFLGSISYALYLLHQNIGYAILLQAREFGLPATLSIALTTGAVIILAYLATTWVEQPSIKWIRKRYKSSSASG